jgi:CBS domain-containing protein
MTPHDRLIAHVGEPETAQAEETMRKHKIKKLPLLNADGTLRGLITAKDLIAQRQLPFATRDAQGRLRVGAAIGAKGDYLERAAELLRASRVVAYARPGHEAAAKRARALGITYHAGVVSPLASRDLRALVRRGESVRYQVPETVRRYIATHNLYAGGRTVFLAVARHAVEKLLSFFSGLDADAEDLHAVGNVSLGFIDEGRHLGPAPGSPAAAVEKNYRGRSLREYRGKLNGRAVEILQLRRWK